MTPIESDRDESADLRHRFDAGQSWRDDADDELAADERWEPRWVR